MSITVDYARRLLAGEVICRWTDEQAFDAINHEDAGYLINEHLAFLGAKLAKTPNDNGFYLVMDPSDPNLKQRSREVFNDILKNYRTVLAWMSIFMKSIAPDRPVMGGDSFRVIDIYNQIAGDPTLQNDLNRIKALKGDTIRKQVDNLISMLSSKGIIIEVNKASEVYQFTAKIDLINEYLEFIVDHESIAVEDEPDNRQASLL